MVMLNRHIFSRIQVFVKMTLRGYFGLLLLAIEHYERNLQGYVKFSKSF